MEGTEGGGEEYLRIAADIMLICERGCMPDKPAVARVYKSPSGSGEAQGPHALDLTYVYITGDLV